MYIVLQTIHTLFSFVKSIYDNKEDASKVRSDT